MRLRGGAAARSCKFRVLFYDYDWSQTTSRIKYIYEIELVVGSLIWATDHRILASVALISNSDDFILYSPAAEPNIFHGLFKLKLYAKR